MKIKVNFTIDVAPEHLAALREFTSSDNNSSAATFIRGEAAEYLQTYLEENGIPLTVEMHYPPVSLGQRPSRAKAQPVDVRLISLKFASHTDHITDDGTELTRQPYPFHVTPDGSISRQDFWKGTPSQVIGFVDDPSVEEITLWWRDVAADPSKTVGKYAVTSSKDGKWATHLSAVESVAVNDW